MADIASLPALQPEQAVASRPDSHVWLSASAGTGKTHVLAARVYRLLLGGVHPEHILCLTFTKAGAAEMANRIHERLALWVQMDDTALFGDLEALGAASGPDARDFARSLFARVLEATGGGLRIQTIHSFCHQLLAAFPLEAGLAPGFRPLDEREQAAMAREALAEMLVEAEGRGDTRLIGAIQALSIRMGEGDAEAFLMRCASAGDVLVGLGDDIKTWLFRRLGLPPGNIDAFIAGECSHAGFIHGIDRIIAANRSWGAATGIEHADIAERFLAAAPNARAEMLEPLVGIAHTAKGEPRKYSPRLQAADPDYAELAMALGTRCAALISIRAQAGYAELLAEALYAGREYAIAYAEAKRFAGAVDFDDLIRRTVALLEEPGMGDWIRYKLDSATDHILVDEAQDTNKAQWSIIGALAEEYFAGLGSRDDRLRTLFVVGDFKQAIFGFQGTSPRAFADARGHFAGLAASDSLDWEEVTLDRSFRSTPAVLELVDATVAALGPPALGLDDTPVHHRSARPFPGEVLLFDPVVADIDEDEEDAGEEDWQGRHVRLFAAKLARQIASWLADGLMLESQGRPIEPGDIMILVRSRKDLARLIVARLYEEGVEVAGIDRLRLNDPLAVRDLLAALKFVLQPADDLNLASLLVSPLIGWSQDELMERALRRSGLPLWPHLQETLGRDLLAPLYDLLGRADLSTPYRYLEHILSGPMQGRRKLLQRLGREARDPIEELLNQSLAFERETHPSLQRFVDWFERGVVDVKREAAEGGGAVRVLTVHGAKGLQAPMVILADATQDPEAGNRRLSLSLDTVPILPPRRLESAGPVAEAAEAAHIAEMQEHWRLLYVALTRAEERLVVAGALGPRARGTPPAASWHAKVGEAMSMLGAVREEDDLWGQRLAWRGQESLSAAQPKPASTSARQAEPLPLWLRAPAPAEARPPRPLAPSAAVADDSTDPPPAAVMQRAAERGRLLHALFERLPALPVDERAVAAERWLARIGSIPDAAERAEIARSALAVIADPRFADVFAPDALAEAPIAAIVGEHVIGGTVDRLCVGTEVVLVVDFKTGSRVPAGAEAAPLPHIRQMAAYAAALEAIFPDRRIEAALLYTSGPRLIPLSDPILAPHKPGFPA